MDESATGRVILAVLTAAVLAAGMVMFTPQHPNNPYVPLAERAGDLMTGQGLRNSDTLTAQDRDLVNPAKASAGFEGRYFFVVPRGELLDGRPGALD
jgi:hypothetical protein